jgi:hypothetical protein
MAQKQSLIDQYRKLQEIKTWLADKLFEESDRETRDALFFARDSIGLALLYFEEIEYRTEGAYNRND